MEIYLVVTILNNKNTKGYIGKLYTYSTIWEQNILANIHIYVARTIFLIFCDHQDTESEISEIEMNIYQTILTHKNISRALWDNIMHTLQYGRENCGSY